MKQLISEFYFQFTVKHELLDFCEREIFLRECILQSGIGDPLQVARVQIKKRVKVFFFQHF